MSRYAVIIATHRRPAWLARAVRSVKAQSHPDVDVIVVSDAPCPQSDALVLPLLAGRDLFVQRWGTPGPGESRNVGLRLAVADFVLFLDDDDELSPDFIGDVEVSRASDAHSLIYADFTIATHGEGDGLEAPLSLQTHSLAGNDPEGIHVRNFIPNSCLVYPAAALRGRTFDPGLTLNEDWDFILNVMAAAPLRHLPVQGPVIHKTPGARRGNSNNHLLLETYRAIYSARPAPTSEIKALRQALLASSGLAVPLEDL